jgi:nicotinamidase-related amidase
MPDSKVLLVIDLQNDYTSLGVIYRYE